MDILDRINARKREEVAEAVQRMPVAALERSPFFSRPVRSISRAVRESVKHGIIAEFKRSSPSAGAIRQSARPQEIIPAYVNAGAAAISVLTDSDFFGGSAGDLCVARGLTEIPILRKDFIISEYQIGRAHV
mgnify:CR=1 FL=1